MAASTCVVKVNTETLKACMTCPLCDKVLKEATTVSLCLHTFCRKCIYEKLTDEEEECCPVCNIDLGVIPVEKLRPDYNLEDIRAKIFPYKRRKVEASDAVTPEPLPVQKERSLSSLVVSAPKVSMQTGRRSKGVSKKTSFQGSGLSAEEHVKKENASGDHSMRSNLQNSLKDSAMIKMQDASSAKHFNNQRFDEDRKNDVEVIRGKADLWTPLNCLVEAANRSKSSRETTQGQFIASLEQSNNYSEMHNPGTKTRAEQANATEDLVSMSKNKIKEYGKKTRVHSESNGVGLISGPMKRGRLRAPNRKRDNVSGESSAAAGSKENRRNIPVWLTLVASEDQKGEVSLPQISKCYLRINDGSVPVSCIQKYLVKKLDLHSEAEVEIRCRDEPVLPSLQLRNLIDLWFKTSSTSIKIPALPGSSAKDFVMVLSYCRKVQAI